MCKVIRLVVNCHTRFSIRRLDRTTTGIGNRYFNSVGEARNYAKSIGLEVIN